jgi:Ca-activated chloride channel family protein
LIDELVELSTRHGILTPYTAFLADERTELAAVEENRTVASEQLSILGREVTGQVGVSQRAFKGRLQQAQQDSAVPQTPAEGQILFRGSGGGGGQFGAQQSLMQGGGGGGGGFALTRDRALRRGATVIERFDGQVELVESVRQVGNKTFYRRDGAWIDSLLADKDTKALEKATVVEQFSDDFFALLRSQSADDTPYFTFDEPVTVALKGQVVRIVPPKQR